MDKPLELSPEQMRHLGYKAVDAIVDHLGGLSDKPAARTISRKQSSRICQDIPELGRDAEEVLEEFLGEVLGAVAHLNHPRFFAFIPSPANYISMLADFLVSGFNVFAGTWLASSGPSEIELRVLDWFRRLCGWPAATRGVFVSGGSMANLTALGVARFSKLDQDFSNGLLYCSDQTHSSIDRAVAMLGLRPDQLRKIKACPAGVLNLELLDQSIRDDKSRGKRPFCVIANIGTTSTGALDPLPELADLCQEHDVWLHGDGAYGAAAVLSSKGRALLPGIERVDSLTVDPHKWMFQTIECAFLLVKNGALLRNCFQIRPEYLKDVERPEQEVNFCDYGLQLTRRPRALKLWLSLQVFGQEQFRAGIDRGLWLAARAEAMILEHPAWSLASRAQLGILAFRFIKGELSDQKRKQLHMDLVKAIHQDGAAMLSTTVLEGKTVIRLCPINPATELKDLETTLERLTELAGELLKAEQEP
jgi:aromatic-L-amino-acid/L-tryptophan decarboxylase